VSNRLSPVAEDYLKAIWNEKEWSDTPVTVKSLADRLSVSPSTVSETVARLSKKNLVMHQPYGAIELTDEGRAYAVATVRRHRLIETLLVEDFGYSWDEVHEEAEILEHAVSDLLLERIDARLGRPTRDPHGDRIPTAEGAVAVGPGRSLRELQPGASATVSRISDADPDVLRYFASVGITLDTVVTVVDKRDYAGVMSITTYGEDEIHLGDAAVAAVWVNADS
jgi:DtxR family Mn-dependent transcriptional regulator